MEPAERSEHIEFDMDAFLDSIPKPLSKYEPQCPCCLVDMKFGVIVLQDGSDFQYYRCPMNRFGTKCYVTSSKENLVDYLTHPYYAKIAPENFKCACDLSIILAMSKSQQNPDCLYLKCAKWTCKLFQWINEPSKGLGLKLAQNNNKHSI